MKTTLMPLIAALTACIALPACASSGTTAAAKTKPYPLKTCIVSDNELGSMGKVVTKVYNDQEVKFCCKPCVKKFDANPEKYLAKIK